MVIESNGGCNENFVVSRRAKIYAARQFFSTGGQTLCAWGAHTPFSTGDLYQADFNSKHSNSYSKSKNTEIHHKTDPFPSLPYTAVVMPSRPKRCSSNTQVPSTRMKPKTTILLLDAAAIQRQQRGAGRISSDEKTNITAVKNHALSRAVNPRNSPYKKLSSEIEYCRISLRNRYVW